MYKYKIHKADFQSVLRWKVVTVGKLDKVKEELLV